MPPHPALHLLRGTAAGDACYHPPRTRGSTGILGVLGAAVALAACGGAPRPDTVRGTALPAPWEKPAFTLTATTGAPYDFRRETEGWVTLLFFGYTHCPDVCPVHMANLAAVLDKAPPDVASRVKVVFVSTDPERDTPERLRRWLDGFDARFVGLRGPLTEVNAVQRSIGLAPAVKQEPASGGADYLVGHAAQVIAYTADNRAHVVYAFGTRQADWAHDLPILVRADWSDR